LVIASFVAIMDPNTMRLSTYFLTLWESFRFHYYLHVPAIILLLIGIYGLSKKQKIDL
jgi:hypothetical protein